MSKSTGSVRHTHQYYRADSGLWHCSGIDGCTHYMPKNMPEPAGRESICWQCNEKFQLAPYNMRDSKPICDNCTETNEAIERLTESKLAAVPQMGYMERMRAVSARKRELRDKAIQSVESIQVEEDKPTSEEV